MISDATIGVAKYLHDKIESAYDCIPQVIKKGNSIGFNVDGREAGKVEQVSIRDIRSTFYAPSKEELLPVFA